MPSSHTLLMSMTEQRKAPYVPLQYVPESMTYLDRERERGERALKSPVVRDPRRHETCDPSREEMFTRKEWASRDNPQTLLDKLLQIQLQNRQKEKVKQARETLVEPKVVKSNVEPISYIGYRLAFNQKTNAYEFVPYKAVVPQ